jgi:hypothetical protein
LYRLEVDLQAVVDLAGAQVLPDALADADFGLDDLTVTQASGEAAQYLGRERILVPSTAGDGKVLAVFIDRLLPESRVDDIDFEIWTEEVVNQALGMAANPVSAPSNRLARPVKRKEDSMHRRLIGALSIGALLFASLLVAGCGSSSSTTTTTTAAISKAEFVSKGNAICLAGNKKEKAETMAFYKKIGISEKEAPSKAQANELVETVLAPGIQSQIDSVKALGAPSGEEQQVTSALESAQETLNKIKAKPEQLFSNQNPFKATGEQLHALGLTQCASES